MTQGKLAVVILDALDVENIRNFEMERIEQLYNEKGKILGCSTHPHTVVSNQMIWGGETQKVYWARDQGGKWCDPGRFDKSEGVEENEDIDLVSRQEIEIAFIWDVLDRHGFDVSAIQIPFVLPPYSFNELEELDAWFPSEVEDMREHVQQKPELVEEHARAGKDFIASSIAMPDKWLHKLDTKGDSFQSVVERQAPMLDEAVGEMIDVFESQGYDWILLGDHGSPREGRSPLYSSGSVGRHDKESVIISNLDNVPSYTSELYKFFLDYFDADDISLEELDIQVEEGVSDQQNIIKKKLMELGYL